MAGGAIVPQADRASTAEGRISRRAAEAHASLPYAGYHYVPLGAVADGERIAHVLFRNALDPDDAQTLARELWGRAHPHVATCRRQPDGTWRLVADHDFLHVASVIISGVREEDATSDADDADA